MTEKKSLPVQKEPIEHIIFDCDSTLTTIEGIDELAALVDKKEEIALLTKKAMQGELPLEGVFFERIDTIRPTHDAMVAVGKQYCRSLSQNVRVILDVAQFLGKSIYIFSAGYLPSLHILGDYLGVGREYIHAVDVLFDREGDYLYCPRDQLLTLTDGKLRLVRSLGLPPSQTAMIGDGANDLSVREGVDLFVGYRGERPNAFMDKNADVYIDSDDILPYLSLLLTDHEKQYLETTHFAEIVRQSNYQASMTVRVR